MTAWSGAFQNQPRAALTFAAERAARLVVVAQGAPPLQHLLGGTPTNFKGAGSSAGPRLAGFGWFLVCSGRLARRLPRYSIQPAVR